jgi:hypothetical protein
MKAAITSTKSPKPETPFKTPTWPWNFTPQAGVPTRQRCQSIVTEDEREAGAKLIAVYREWESVSAVHRRQDRAAEPVVPR